jgi:hypothetical protein
MGAIPGLPQAGTSPDMDRGLWSARANSTAREWAMTGGDGDVHAALRVLRTPYT